MLLSRKRLLKVMYSRGAACADASAVGAAGAGDCTQSLAFRCANFFISAEIAKKDYCLVRNQLTGREEEAAATRAAARASAADGFPSPFSSSFLSSFFSPPCSKKRGYGSSDYCSSGISIEKFTCAVGGAGRRACLRRPPHPVGFLAHWPSMVAVTAMSNR